MNAATVLAAAGLLLAGAFAWSLGEYVLHRFVMHELKGKGLPSREHLIHHALAGENEGKPFLSWLGIAVMGAVGILPLGLLVAGAWWGSAAYVGWLVGYGFYEYVHGHSHTHGPRNAYGRWVRVHHFHHHHGHPMANHGVTTPLWDKVFGTLERPEVIRVPRRHAMRWLVDGAGEIHPELADRYVLVGPADPAGRMAAIDRARAFANLAPTPA
jgi:sterol desaturase/sphingolipid hydroxylase (fatty acid hydroxylase superfamily)